MKTEEWRGVPGWDDLYEVSSLGRVRRLRQRYYKKSIPMETPVLVRPKAAGKKRNYLYVILAKNGMKVPFYIHELVLLAFVGFKPTDFHEAAHGDGDSLRNHLDNLSWKTRKENHADKLAHGTDARGEKSANAKLTNTQADEIRRRGKFEVHQKLADEFKVSRSLVSMICRGDARAYS